MSEEKEQTQEEFEKMIDAKDNMTPGEKRYAKLFHHEVTVVVRDMDRLTLRAHIEELAEIASEARIRHDGAKSVDAKRSNADNGKRSQGFERSVNADKTSEDAINTIKIRQERMSKQERLVLNLQKSFESAGLSKQEAQAEAVRLTQNRTVLEHELKNPKPTSEVVKVLETPVEVKEVKKLINPFAKKDN